MFLSLFFHFHVLYWTQTKENRRNGGGLGMRLHPSMLEYGSRPETGNDLLCDKYAPPSSPFTSPNLPPGYRGSPLIRFYGQFTIIVVPWWLVLAPCAWASCACCYWIRNTRRMTRKRVRWQVLVPCGLFGISWWMIGSRRKENAPRNHQCVYMTA